MRKSNVISKVMLAAMLMAAALAAGGCGDKSKDAGASAKVETQEAGRDADTSKEADGEETDSKKSDSKKSDGKKSDSSQTSGETELEKKYGKKASFQQLMVLVKAMSQNDADTILEIQKLPQNSVVTADDVSYILARSELSPFMGADETEVVDFEETSGSASAKIKNGSDAAIVNLVLNDDNEWVPVIEGLYVENMLLIAAGKADITFNGCKMDESQFAETDTTKKDGSVIYTLTVPNRPFKVVTISTVFGTLETEITPGTSDSDKYNARPELGTDSVLEAQNAFRDIMTSMLADAQAGMTNVSDYQKYFSDQADTELMASAVSGLQSMVKEDENIVCSEVVSRPGSVPSYLMTNNRCILNIGYKLSFIYNGSPRDQKRVTWIMLDKRDDGSYGIFKTGDEAVFSSLNPYTQQY